MKVIKIIVDNSTAVLAWITSLLGMLVLLGLDLNKEQIAGITVFSGATIGLLAAFATVTKRRVVTLVDNAGVIRNGQGSTQQTGTPADVTQDPDTGLLTPQAPVKPDLLAA